MKTNSPIPLPLTASAGDTSPAVWRSGGFRAPRRPAATDFRSRSFHLRQHRPVIRARFSVLRGLALALVMAGQLALQPACGGTITGTVHAEGKAGAEGRSAADDAYGSRKYKFVQRVDYAAMKDFVVFIDGLTVTNAVNTNVLKVTTARVAQHSAIFSPHILPVLAGTTVEWPNNDEIFHNVFSMSDAKQFDLGLYKDNPPDKHVTFDKPGQVDVYCSIHENMHCIVLVMTNPYFAVTDGDGHYTITGVPPGKYTLKAWHERLPADTQEITVPETGGVKADFTLTIKNLPGS
ncbi:MAG TPA: carboxypeptidase regulatory-like domain-containing protein [Candidatus Acidoferrales bacterium]|jgi:plastocyanin|nr:carboxypeptidase regulatory-like domain-containing protein [Candidatus Acidoferrales bacterium]